MKVELLGHGNGTYIGIKTKTKPRFCVFREHYYYYYYYYCYYYYTRYKQFNWYGHVQRMDQGWFPRRILEWCPPRRQRKGRPWNLWMQQVATGMRERRIGDLEWVYREGWRKKINLPQKED